MKSTSHFIAIVITLLMVDICRGSNLDIIKKRLSRLEYRLAEDVALLREEMYNKLHDLDDLQSSMDEASNSVTNNMTSLTKDSQILEDFERIGSELTSKVMSLQKGLVHEKRVVRSIQDVLTSTEQDSAVRTNLLKEFLQKLSMNITLHLTKAIQEMKNEVKTLHKDQETRTANSSQTGNAVRFSDCSDWLRHGHVTNGVYTVHPETMWRPLQVYCDMTTEDGGWTVFQRRQDGSENFDRPWLDYQFGFGDLKGEHWLGNEFVHRLTSRAPHELRIELEDFVNDRRVAKYGLFSVGSPDDLFRLSVQYFSGNVTDNLIPSHHNMQFSTKDNGPSSSCSASYKGGFWYSKCHGVNINGLYLKGEHESFANGVNWHGFRGYHYSLKMTEMKFRAK